MKLLKKKRATKRAKAPVREHPVATREGASRRTTFFVTQELDQGMEDLNTLANKVLGTKDKKHYSLASVLRNGALSHIESEKKTLRRAMKGELHAKKRKK